MAPMGKIVGVFFVLYCLSGCLAKEATGEWSVAVYGEEFIEEGINSDFFADDWAVEFDKFLMVVGQVGTGFGSPWSGYENVSTWIHRFNEIRGLSRDYGVGA